MDQNKLDLLKTEFSFTQQQMDKYDQLSMTIKAWAVTLWVASSGWALDSGKKEILLLGIVLVGTFWFFDGINKTFRTNYKKRRDEVARILRDYCVNGKIEKDVCSPQPPTYSLKGFFKNTITLHISLPYLLFVLISVILFFV